MENIYVSPFGNDANTGTFASPLLTIAAAIQRGRGRDFMSTLTINAMAGTFRGGALPLFSSDSGVSFVSPDGPGAAILSGAAILGGWEVFDGDVYRAPYTGASCPMRTLFEDGVRGRAARFPKLVIDPLYPSALAPYLTSIGVDQSHTQIEFDDDELDMSTWVMRQTQALIWSGGNIAWFTDTIPIVSVNIPLNLIDLSQATRYVVNNGVPGSRYFIQNVVEYLTEPGEFVWDGSHVYYIFRGDPETAVIEVPQTYDIFDLRGTPSAPVADVTFDGLALTGTAMPTWYRHAHVDDGQGYTDRNRGPLDFLATSNPYDRQMTLPQNRHGLISLSNCDSIQITRCHLSGAGLHGIYAGGTEGAYNKSHNIADSWIEQCGHSGVYVDGSYPGGGDVSRDWTVTDVKINNVGQLVGNGGGLQFINSGHHTISHVEGSNGPRNGIFIAAYTDIPEGNCYSSDILLDESEFTDFCQDSGDVGAIGLFGLSSVEGGPVLTNTIRQVRVTGANAQPSMTDAAPNGIFTDNQSWGQVFQNVEVSDTQGNQFRINDSGGHTYTNTSFQSDGSPNPSFNPALMSPDIGLTNAWPF